MSITIGDRAVSAADRIAEEIAKNNGKYSKKMISAVIEDEFSKTEEAIYNEAMFKLTPIQKKVIQSKMNLEEVKQSEVGSEVAPASN